MIRNLLVAACMALLVGSASAAPTIDLSWSGCSPVLHDRVLPPGATASDLYVIASGLPEPTKAYTFKLYMGSEVGACSPNVVPDAWRYDNAGCEGLALMTTSLDSKSCPTLVGSSTPVLANSLQYDALVQQLVLTFSASYPTQPANPGTTYSLLHIRFDHTYAVQGAGNPPSTCGGFEKPMCFTLWGGFDGHGNCYGPGQVEYGAYLAEDGTTHPFSAGAVDANSFRIDSSIQACNLATPVKPTTWGAIRGQYR